MKNKKVFALLGFHDYEGADVIGIYSTYKKAEVNKGGGFDSYEIKEWNINGKEVKKRVKKLSKKESDKLRKKFFELNAPFLNATLKSIKNLSTPESGSFRDTLLKAANGK